jgi:hypothetical protein
MEFKVGQKVYSLAHGWGEVINVDESELPICFRCAGLEWWFTKDGRLNGKHAPISLFHSEPEIIVPKWQPKEGEWCWFWDGGSESAFLSKFQSRYFSAYKHCAPFVGELPEHLKNI